MRKTFLFLFFFGWAATSCAQSFNTAKFDSLFNALDSNQQASGAVTVFRNGTVLYNRTVGFSHEKDSKRIKATGKTKYRLGTATQIVTATMILQLFEQGKLKLKEPIMNYFPELPNSKFITVANLLQHRSGLYDYLTNDSISRSLNVPMNQNIFLSVMRDKKTVFAPDGRQEFNNSNYVILGYIIEKVTGKTINEAFRELIGTPAGMNNTYFGTKVNTGIFEAQSFIKTGKWTRAAETNLTVLHGAGGLVSTPGDMAKFISMLYHGSFVNTRSLEFMVGPVNEYSSGIFSFDFSGTEMFGSIGNVDGFMSAVLFHPDSLLSVAYMSNGIDYSFEEILTAVLKISMDQPYNLPVFKVYPVSQQKLTEYVGKYSIQGSPLVVDIFIREMALHADVSGQNTMRLMSVGPDKFRNEKGGFEVEFNPSAGEMTLIQGQSLFLFTKE